MNILSRLNSSSRHRGDTLLMSFSTYEEYAKLIDSDVVYSGSNPNFMLTFKHHKILIDFNLKEDFIFKKKSFT